MATIPEALAIAIQHHQNGRLQAAEQIYRQILEADPAHAQVYYLLGALCHRLVQADGLGRLDEAVANLRQAARLKPDHAEAHNHLGIALAEKGHAREAIASFEQALRVRPGFVEAQNNLRLALAGRHNDQGNTNLAEVERNRGYAFEGQGKLDEAVACYQQAVNLKPDYADAHNNLGLALLAKGSHDEAVACFRQAIHLAPAFRKAHSNLLFALNFCPGLDAKTIYEEHCRWNRQYAEPLAKFIPAHDNDRSADRRLRIGYVSANFHDHPVGRFLLPLLETHDHGNFEVFCYASVDRPDAITDRFRSHADAWRDVRELPDEQLARAVRQDRIDILVDLTMHMARNRLLVFARKPAPVQVTYLAYCGTTGLKAIDYRLTDPYLDPPGLDKGAYSEQSIHLPATYWCYRPLAETPATHAPPASHAGHVTFGCLNNFCKVTDPTLAVWSRLLRGAPDSKLLLHAHAGNHRERVRKFLAREGVAPERVAFAGFVPRTEYFRLYQRIDVALDPFPYAGGTTTCDALWMGVPVVSLAGQTAVGRGGVSILSNVGLPELIAYDSEQYVRIAVELAQDSGRLSEFRATLRDRMRDSRLTDAPSFVRDVEAAYREMWRRWCVQ